MDELKKCKLLQQIANTLVVYAYHIENNGLVNGKTGIMLFLYKYARYTNNEFYEDFAGEILDGLMRVSASLPLDFENGLAGLGWTICDLIEKKHVEGNADSVLSPIDKILLLDASHNKGISVMDSALYLSKRWELTKEKDFFHQKICDILQILSFTLKNFNEPVHLSRINRILSFLFFCDTNKGYLKFPEHIYEALLCTVTGMLKNSLEQRLFCKSDIIVLEHLLHDSCQKNIIIPNGDFTLETKDLAQATWQYYVYFSKDVHPTTISNV